ncbi:hypothetical protein DUI87_11246 [Hirundo rustica rustica]|uniref:Uncharacterized protein n=1 Tax=Hirundo rustica rustica TaxID=333673 RepID=A0A3M0KHM6_HIRRU|nr:hypothetical protein DUI87_11246 [Hirundo rustica rustica]
MLEQLFWQDLRPHRVLTLKQPVPEGSVEVTHAAAAHEDLQPMEWTHNGEIHGEVHGELSPMGGIPEWSRGRTALHAASETMGDELTIIPIPISLHHWGKETEPRNSFMSEGSGMPMPPLLPMGTAEEEVHDESAAQPQSREPCLAGVP